MSPTGTATGALRLAWGWIWPVILALALMGFTILVLYCLLGTLNPPSALYPGDY